jgi:hypothetical protein
MRRTIAAVGLVGLGLLGTTLPAIATPDGQVTVCHQTGSDTNPEFEIDVNGQAPENGNGNGGNGNGNGNGGNGNGVGQVGECNPDNEQAPAEEPPAEEPPAEEPPAEEPPAEEQPPAAVPPAAAPPAAVPPAAAPAAVVPAAPLVKPAAKPAAAAPVAAMPVAVPAATNEGYNVQTAAGGGTASGIPAWLATVTALLAGLSAVVLARGGARARKLGG